MGNICVGLKKIKGNSEVSCLKVEVEKNNINVLNVYK